MGIRAIFVIGLIGWAGVTASAATFWGNDQQDEFLETLRKQGLPAFTGDWKLVVSEGETCAANETVTLTGPADLVFAAAPEGIPSPSFTVTAINGGNHVVSSWASSVRSEAVWDGPQITQREISRGYVSVARADRVILLSADGTLAIAISETAPRTNRSYRCVYARPPSSSAN